ncbi:TetR family transcriptional regulator [Actinomadura meridiana]|uniref:TetR family transcriptional regulator n=1 Tax=Actinomadura meridiana TaxID=559626 RepID=A0ABP8BUE3_9ACTN
MGPERVDPALDEVAADSVEDHVHRLAPVLVVFDKVTIADVAAAAGVAKMTVTNHFPRKEDLVLDIADELIAGPARVVAARAPGESVLAALRGDFLAALERCDPTLGFSDREFAAMVLGSPALRARLREIHEEREDALASALAHGLRWDDLACRLASAQIVTLQRVLMHEILDRTANGEPKKSIRDDITPTAQRAFDQLHRMLPSADDQTSSSERPSANRQRIR